MSLHYRQIIDINVSSIEKPYFPNRHYVYGVLVTWPDSTESKVFRKYSHFVNLKRELDKSFGSDFGDLLPEPSGNKYLARFERFSDAVERKEHIIKFCKTILLNYQDDVCFSEIVCAFFEPRGQDLRSIIKISSPIRTQEYVCTHDFDGETESELTVYNNQKVIVHQKNLNGWWFVSSSYGQGYVPQAVLRCCHELDFDSDSGTIKVGLNECYQVKRDYKGVKYDEIDLEKGDCVRVIEKRLSGWWMVENKGITGLAPAVCLISFEKKSSISSSESLNGSANSELISVESIINKINQNSENDQSDIYITKF